MVDNILILEYSAKSKIQLQELRNLTAGANVKSAVSRIEKKKKKRTRLSSIL